MWQNLSDWDRGAFIYLNNLGVDDYDSFWIFITQIRHWVPLYIFFLILFGIAFNWRRVLLSILFLLITLFSTVAFTNFIKNYIQRLRPNNSPALKGLIRVLQEPHNFSFFFWPCINIFCCHNFCYSCVAKKFKWVYVFYIWPILFCMSRIFVGVHYPSDILVGSGVGSCIALIIYWLYKKALSYYFEKPITDIT